MIRPGTKSPCLNFSKFNEERSSQKSIKSHCSNQLGRHWYTDIVYTVQDWLKNLGESSKPNPVPGIK